MTVIAWDGRTLAADKQGTLGSIKVRQTKIRKTRDGVLLAAAGETPLCEALMEWWENGALTKEYPKVTGGYFAILIVIRERKVYQYEMLPIPMEVEESVYAWGSGRELALGAMAMGADARRAVEIASTYHTGCGMGVDTIDVD